MHTDTANKPGNNKLKIFMEYLLLVSLLSLWSKSPLRELVCFHAFTVFDERIDPPVSVFLVNCMNSRNDRFSLPMTHAYNTSPSKEGRNCGAYVFGNKGNQSHKAFG